jgi:hypothetical protein
MLVVQRPAEKDVNHTRVWQNMSRKGKVQAPRLAALAHLFPMANDRNNEQRPPKIQPRDREAGSFPTSGSHPQSDTPVTDAKTLADLEPQPPDAPRPTTLGMPYGAEKPASDTPLEQGDRPKQPGKVA